LGQAPGKTHINPENTEKTESDKLKKQTTLQQAERGLNINKKREETLFLPRKQTPGYQSLIGGNTPA